MENTNNLKIYTLDQAKDKYIGKLGSEKRDKYEYELRLDLLGEMIKRTRKERNLTQTEHGRHRMPVAFLHLFVPARFGGCGGGGGG